VAFASSVLERWGRYYNNDWIQKFGELAPQIETYRLFIAISLPEHVKDAIERIAGAEVLAGWRSGTNQAATEGPRVPPTEPRRCV